MAASLMMAGSLGVCPVVAARSGAPRTRGSKARAGSQRRPMRELARVRRTGAAPRTETEAEGDAPAQETRLLSVAPAPLLTLAAAEGLREALEPIGELVRSWNLPEWLVHWGHPGNMAVVLFAMGGYGSYLGWQIRLAGDAEARLAAKEAHPKLMAGMFFFFALGATGGLTSLVTSNRPIFESPHAFTGLAGLALLTAQTVLSSSFAGKPELRSVHAYLGSATMALFLVHAALGLKLGLSF